MGQRPAKECPNCARAFNGRANQRFCSSTCRIQFNNNKIRDAREPVVEINKVLYRNRAVLKDLYHRFGSDPIELKLLNRSDYNKRYYTHHTRSQNNELYTWCYDYAWIISGEHHIQITKSKDA